MLQENAAAHTRLVVATGRARRYLVCNRKVEVLVCPVAASETEPVLERLTYQLTFSIDSTPISSR